MRRPSYLNPYPVPNKGLPLSWEYLRDVYIGQDQQLAAFLVVAQCWSHVELGFDHQPESSLNLALARLSPKEQERMSSLLATHIRQSPSDAIEPLRGLPPALKQTAWNPLRPNEKKRIHDYLDSREGRPA